MPSFDEECKDEHVSLHEVKAEDATITHEATLGKIGNELFYLMSRGLSEEDAVATIVLGFIDAD